MKRMPIRTVVVDDEPYSRDELMYLLSKTGDVEVVAAAGSHDEALELILQHEPDAVFLDIEMGEKNGLELAGILTKLAKPPHIVFATAYPDFAITAFRLNALDYVLKPFDEGQVQEAVNRILSSVNQESKPPANDGIIQGVCTKLAVHCDEVIHYLSPNAIDYIFREGSVTKVVSQGSDYETRLTLKELSEKLKDYSFFRTHKGYLVNLNRVEEMTPWFNGACQLKLENVEGQIPVSRNYVKLLRQELEL